ncbi:Tyrosinase like protein [Verticillium longisporum]|nr:Tyrosinase like protein [Verticillium longisporum]
MLLPSFTALCALATIPWVDARTDYPVVGVKSGINPLTRETPARRNISALYEEAGPQWDLYVDALKAMQRTNETDPLSYFQIASIHGQPYGPWPPGAAQTGAQQGYCPHNEALFGTWHRAYLSLYEQTLVKHAQEIAQTYPPRYRRQYVEAADRLRAAWWDWASDSRVPPVTTQKTVVINRPYGDGLRPLRVLNPFYTYKYPQAAQDGDYGRFSGVGNTKRCTQQGNSYPKSANELLSKISLKSQVYTALSRAKSWSEISTSANGGSSIEGPHGSIHIRAACGLDFVYLETSGFEPLFMLHHVNVDRFLAFWQVLHYENGKIEFNYKTDGLYATPKGTTVTAKSPLRPFENERGPLTSEDMTNIGDWGYTYEPIEFWRQSPAEQKRVVTQYVNKWYGPQRQATAPRAVKARGVAEPQYYANLEVERSELDLPAMVDLYVKGRHAGSFALLGMPMHGKSYEEIPLQQAIQDAAFSLNITSALGMREVLNHHLEARITKPDGTLIPLEKVPSLKIDLEEVQVAAPETDEELPKFGLADVRPARVKALTKEVVEVLVTVHVPCPTATPSYGVL